MLKPTTQTTISTQDGKTVQAYSLKKLAQETGISVSRLPYSIRVLVENLLRNVDGYKVKESDVMNALNWQT